jgi:hypothetical protein
MGGEPVNVYFDKEEAAFVLSQEKGFVRRLVREAMGVPKGAEEAQEVDEERAREHFPPKLAFPSGASKTPAYVPDEPVKDTFGPRLKR